MENLLWIVVGVLLLMCLTTLKAVWRLKFQVELLQKDIAALHNNSRGPGE